MPREDYKINHGRGAPHHQVFDRFSVKGRRFLSKEHRSFHGVIQKHQRQIEKTTRNNQPEKKTNRNHGRGGPHHQVLSLVAKTMCALQSAKPQSKTRIDQKLSTSRMQ